MRAFGLLIIFLELVSVLRAQSKDSAGVIVLEGAYQGKNLYIQNPHAGSGQGFCTQKVTVNGLETKDDIQSSAFEINLSVYGLKPGDKIIVKIFHKSDCKPKVILTDYHVRPKGTFNLKKLTADSSGLIKFTTTDEQHKLPFVIEQFRWNKWVKAGEVDGKGQTGDPENHYEIRIIPHSGENTVRVKQVDYSSQPRLSKPYKFYSSAPKVRLQSTTVSKDIQFDAATSYEIYDSYGNILRKGHAQSVDCTTLPNGIYYLNYDNTVANVKKNAKPVAIYERKRAVSKTQVYNEALLIYQDSTITLVRYYSDNSSFDHYTGRITRKNDSTFTFKFKPVFLFGNSARTWQDSARLTVSDPGNKDQEHFIAFKYDGVKDKAYLKNGESKTFLKNNMPVKSVEVSGALHPITGKQFWLLIDEYSEGKITFYDSETPVLTTTGTLRGMVFTIKGINGSSLQETMILTK